MKKLLKKMCIPVLVMGAVLMLFRFVLFIGYVPTESMEPTIPKGSYIVGTRILGELKVGDIIVFRREGRLLVKRIAAVGGDTVMHKGRKKVVPEGCFYVLGDNLDASHDSRNWSNIFISEGSIVAYIKPPEGKKRPNNPLLGNFKSKLFLYECYKKLRTSVYTVGRG